MHQRIFLLLVVALFGTVGSNRVPVGVQYRQGHFVGRAVFQPVVEDHAIRRVVASVDEERLISVVIVFFIQISRHHPGGECVVLARPGAVRTEISRAEQPDGRRWLEEMHPLFSRLPVNLAKG